MARFDMSGLDSIMDEMRRLGEDCSEVAEDMVIAGAEEMKKSWVLTIGEYGLVDSGDMINSIGYDKSPKREGDALVMDIFPRGKDHKGVRNAEKAYILHYGTSKIKARHFVDQVIEYSDVSVVPTMAEVWDRFIQRRME